MALYIVKRKNPYYKLSTWLEDDDDGYVQPVRIVYKNGRAEPEGFYGIMVPLRDVREHLVKVLNRGFDFQRERIFIS